MRARPRTGTTLALASLGIIAVFVLLNQHWGHALGLLPYLLLLACPLLHLFSHGRHGGDHSHAAQRQQRGGDPSTPSSGGIP